MSQPKGALWVNGHLSGVAGKRKSTGMTADQVVARLSTQGPAAPEVEIEASLHADGSGLVIIRLAQEQVLRYPIPAVRARTIVSPR